MEGKTKGDKVDKVFKTEKDIFDFLHMAYKEPKDRIDGRSVLDAPAIAALSTTITALITTPTPSPAPTPIIEPTPAIKPKTKYKQYFDMKWFSPSFSKMFHDFGIHLFNYCLKLSSYHYIIQN